LGLNLLQDRLERIYDLRTPHRVEDFVLHDPAVVRELVGGAAPTGLPEQLVMVQGEDGVDVGLFLDRGLLDRLPPEDPAHALRTGHLEDFCLALEGVSHFLFLAWHAGHERRVTLFEMELQAEIDKFVTASGLVDRAPGMLERLHRALFEDVRFRPELSTHEADRYREANRLAARYCRALKRRFDLPAHEPALVRELRRFYRMPREIKVRHIERGARPR
jgi:hypothetical protein